MTEERKQIYRTAMRLCRMWGVAETLNGDVPPYENPEDAGLLPANEWMVMEWADEYENLQSGSLELWDFFERKIKDLQQKEWRK